MPATASALHASLPSPNCTAARIAAPVPCGPGRVEHEKKTFFSLLENSRSGGGSQGRVSAAQRAERSGEP